MFINADTTLARIIKHHPKALEAIISLHPKFTKLRNPLLQKLMAGRTSLRMAAKVGGIALTDFYTALVPLGFEATEKKPGNADLPDALPAFMVGLDERSMIELDVRPIIASGKDPLRVIVERTSAMTTRETLKIINSFEPAPLVRLLTRKGFEVYIKKVNDDLVETYVYKPGELSSTEPIAPLEADSSWEAIFQRYKDHLHTIDVRLLEMPQPMITILAALENLPAEKALLVLHKRIPVFLLPELADRGFEYRLKENADGSVTMLIFKM